MNETLKNLQVPVAFVITHMGLIFLVYPRNIIASTSEAFWLPVLIGFLIQLGTIIFFLKGIGYFNNQNIVTVMMKKNKWLAWGTVCPSMLCLTAIIILVVRTYAEILSIVFVSGMPLWPLICLLIIIPSYMVLKAV